MKTLFITLLLACNFAYANPLLETRYCGEPSRDEYGNIIRRADVINAFKREHPCPRTLKRTGACKGWAVDHVIPLACGGCDSVSNMQWLPVKVKSGWQDWNKDRFERLIYKSNFKIKSTPRCENKIVIISD